MRKNITLLLIILLSKFINAQCWFDFDIGGNHSMAIDNNGRLLTWGYNAYGQVGDGTTIDRSFPTFIGNDVDWVSVCGGSLHSVALKANGSMWTWGRNTQGELGLGNYSNRNIPTRVGTSNDWVKIFQGTLNTFAQKTDGSLWATGYNYFGNLGDYTTINRNSFVRVGTDTDWLFVTESGYGTYAIKNNGTLWRLGTTHTQVGSDTWIEVEVGTGHAVGIKSDGTLWTWGQNNKGQLGDGTLIFKSVPTQIGTANDWVKVSAGNEHTMALKQNGTLWSWGENYYGQLGIGSNIDQLSPVQVGTATNWIKISSFGDHNKALKNDGTLWAWGKNTYGQLGIPYLSDGRSPVKVNCVTSPNFTCTPSISISASQSPTICLGTALTFTAYPVNGGSAPTYQWVKNGTPIGISSNTLSTNGLSDGDIISCELISNAICSNTTLVSSNSITVSVLGITPPSVTISANQTSICAGSSVSFSVSVIGNISSPMYQWKSNGLNVGTGAITYSSSTLLNTDSVSCVLTTSVCGSNSTVSSNSISISVFNIVTPSVSISANQSTVCAGELVSFMTSYTNAGQSPTFQWYKNGIQLGVNTSTYSSTGLVSSDLISCVLTNNDACSNPSLVTSNSVAISVTQLLSPSISISIADTNICDGFAIFTSTITHGGSLPTYQWMNNGIVVGSNTNAYSPSNLQNGDIVYCELTSDINCTQYSSVTSNSIIVSTSVCTDIETNIKQLNNLVIYPNPAKNKLYISVEDQINYTVILYDKTGRVVYCELNSKIIDTENYQNGVYYLVIESNTKFRTTRKIVILK